MTAPKLDGVRVVITRSPEQAKPLSEGVIDAGGFVVSLPMVEIDRPPDGGAALAAALDALEPSDWLAVLSPNGARAVQGASPLGRQCHLAVVGVATSQPFLDADWKPDLVATVPTAAGLVDALLGSQPPGRILIVQAAEGSDTLAVGLRAEGWSVDRVTGYVNTLPDIDESRVTAAAEADVVVFASPSAVDRYSRFVGIRPSSAVCIGPVTGHEAVSAGFTTVVANAPTVPALLAGITESVARA